MYYCCSINPKRQSEHSGLRPDTSSLVFISYPNQLDLTEKQQMTNNKKQ